MSEANLLERDDELAALAAFVDGIEGSGAKLMIIEGQAGIGKSTLVAEARRLAAADGIRMLVGRGSLLEREFPFGVVRQLFEPELADPKERKRLLSGAAEAAEGVFAAVPGESGGDTSFAALHGLYWLTVDLAAEKPLILIVDDLHWVDHPSLRFISYLIKRLEGLPIGIVAATRPNEPGADAAMLAELAGDPLATSIRPGGLSTDGVRRRGRAAPGPGPGPGLRARLPHGHRRQPAAAARAAEGDSGRGHRANGRERERRLGAGSAGRIARGAAAPLSPFPGGWCGGAGGRGPG